jgi:hypothetical protein
VPALDKIAVELGLDNESVLETFVEFQILGMITLGNS